MPVRTVGPNSEFATISAALLTPGSVDVIILETGYSDETALVTRNGLTIDGGAASLGIALRLAAGVSGLTLTGAAPIDVTDNGEGNSIVGNAGNNVVTVTDGTDAVDGGLGVDRLIVDYRLAVGAITGNSGSGFSEAGGSHQVTITAGTFEDFTVLAGSGADTITTADGDDFIDGGRGANTVSAGQGANTIIGGADADTITALDGGNLIDAGDGRNIVTSGAGADTIRTGFGADTISAGGGDDRITVRGGIDMVHGEAGDDRLTIDYSASVTVVTMTAPTDSVAGQSGSIADLGGNSASFDGIETFVITGGAAGDRIVAGSGNDTVDGGAGDDVLAGGGGADLLTGGTGADTFRYDSALESSSSNNDVILGFERGADRIDLSTVSGSYVNLVYDDFGGTGVYFANLAPGVAAGAVYAGGEVALGDVLTQAGATFILTAAAGGSTLIGGGASDGLIGGLSADVLIGGGGGDNLTGGGGADVFRYQAVSDSTPSVSDVITDFEHGVDKIDLSGIAGGVVNIVHDGAGNSFLYYAPSNGQATGSIAVQGDVEDADVIADAGTLFIDTGAFAGPTAEPAGLTGRSESHGHWDLF